MHSRFVLEHLTLMSSSLSTSPEQLLKDNSREQGREFEYLYDLSLEELCARLQQLGQPAYRANQLYEWIYKHRAASFDQMSNLPASIRKTLADEYAIDPLRTIREVNADQGETIKSLRQTHDGRLVETVLMFYPDRATVCMSCQVGCAVGCSFCATGIGGLERNLTSGEMVSQVVHSANLAEQRNRALTNIVMMGMGEPFHNYTETMKFVATLNDHKGLDIGARRITISTSGIVPFIDRLADEPYQINLAISIHAPTDELRDQLVPINKRWPIAELLAACDRYVDKTHRRISFEYALIKGVNDSSEIARQLALLLRGRLCHVNIIPLNPVDILPYERPSKVDIDQFAETLESAGIPATVRYSRGLDIAAACGQLRAKHTQSVQTSAG